MTFVDQVKAGDSRTNGTDDQQKRAAQKNNIPGILYLDSNAKKETVSCFLIIYLLKSQYLLSIISMKCKGGLPFLNDY